MLSTHTTVNVDSITELLVKAIAIMCYKDSTFSNADLACDVLLDNINRRCISNHCICNAINLCCICRNCNCGSHKSVANNCTCIVISHCNFNNLICLGTQTSGLKIVNNNNLLHFCEVCLFNYHSD